MESLSLLHLHDHSVPEALAWPIGRLEVVGGRNGHAVEERQEWE